VKIRGTAHHIAEKYQQLARDAAAAGDRVISENYFQHAEHYLRIIASAQQSMHQPVVLPRGDEGDDDLDEQEERNERPERAERFERSERQERPDRSERGERGDRREREAGGDSRPVMPMDAPQPFVDNMPMIGAKGLPSSGEDKDRADSRGEDGADDDERSRRRARGTRGRGLRRSRGAIGEEAGGEAADEPRQAAAPAPAKVKSEPAALAEAVAASEAGEDKKPRARRAPRARTAKAETETAASEA
jgi:hypothetical protein